MLPLNSKLIFVIDDEKDIRESLMEAIESEGYATISAPNGLDAISMFEKGPDNQVKLPDLILLDHIMPHMNGARFLELARRNKHLAKVPVILMTANRNLAQKSTIYGADGHLHKPLELDDLFKTIEKHLIH
jgi:two-component system chemotaxis response regulator CheY